MSLLLNEGNHKNYMIVEAKHYHVLIRDMYIIYVTIIIIYIIIYKTI